MQGMTIISSPLCSRFIRRSKRTDTSLTLVPVGPVTNSPSTAFRAW